MIRCFQTHDVGVSLCDVRECVFVGCWIAVGLALTPELVEKL